MELPFGGNYNPTAHIAENLILIECTSLDCGAHTSRSELLRAFKWAALTEDIPI